MTDRGCRGHLPTSGAGRAHERSTCIASCIRLAKVLRAGVPESPSAGSRFSGPVMAVIRRSLPDPDRGGCASRRRLVMSDRSFALTRRRFAQASVRDLRGELDVTHASTLGVAVRHALGPNPKSLVIDLCGVKFVDVRGRAVPLSARRRSLRAGVELRLVRDVQSTVGPLARTRLDRDLDVCRTRADALSPPACTVA